MGKVIKNPIVVNLTFTIEDGNIKLEPTASYGSACEHGELTRKDMKLVHTPAQEATIKDFSKNVWYQQIKDNEGIT